MTSEEGRQQQQQHQAIHGTSHADAARSVAPITCFCQTRQTLLQKTLHPLVDIAPADPDRGGNVGDRHPISHE